MNWQFCSIVFVKTHTNDTIPLSAVSIRFFQIKQNDHKDVTCWLWIWLQNVQYQQTLNTTAWHDTRMNKNNQTEYTIFAPALRTEILGMTASWNPQFLHQQIVSWAVDSHHTLGWMKVACSSCWIRMIRGTSDCSMNTGATACRSWSATVTKTWTKSCGSRKLFFV